MTKEELITSKFDLQECFRLLRFDPKHHLGLGDIRLTIAQQDEICANVDKEIQKIREERNALDAHRIKIEEMELSERNRANALQKEVNRLKNKIESLTKH